MKKNDLERSGILSVGAFAIDYIKRVDRIPVPGSVARIQQEKICNGGHAYNLLVDLVRLGADFPLNAVGWVGHDVDGRAVQEDCAAHHINTHSLRVSKVEHSSYNDVMVDSETGELSSLNRMGAHSRLKLKDVPVEETKSRFLYLGPILGLGELDGEHKQSGTQAAELLRLARKAGMETAVSIVPMAAEAERALAALRYVDYLFLNESGLEILSGVRMRYRSGLDQHALHDAARMLQDRGVRGAVVLRVEEGGVYLPRAGEPVFMPRVHLPRKRIVGLNGGDSAFTAGVLYGLHERMSMGEALQLGLGAAAACSMDLKTSGGVRSASKCLEIYKQYQGSMVADLVGSGLS